MEHMKDADCTVDPRTCLCTVCGVECGAPCPVCGCQSFHADGCVESRIAMPIDFYRDISTDLHPGA
jgi:hypothetical protein